MSRFLMLASLSIGVISAYPNSVDAKDKWLKPVYKECSLNANDWCGEDVRCPAEMPFAIAGDGGMPKVSRKDHSVAMTMNVAISENAWRVRWQNLSNGTKTDVKVMIRVKCSDDGSSWGK